MCGRQAAAIMKEPRALSVVIRSYLWRGILKQAPEPRHTNTTENENENEKERRHRHFLEAMTQIQSFHQEQGEHRCSVRLRGVCMSV